MYPNDGWGAVTVPASWFASTRACPRESRTNNTDRNKIMSGYEIMQQLAYVYATLVEDGERVVDEAAMPKSGARASRLR